MTNQYISNASKEDYNRTIRGLNNSEFSERIALDKLIDDTVYWQIFLTLRMSLFASSIADAIDQLVNLEKQLNA